VSQINKLKIFNDPIYGFITIPNALIYDLIQHPYFQRLRRISQMGLSYLVYPGANHTRFHHALGCMHLMQKQLLYCVLKVAISVEEENALYIAILLHDIGWAFLARYGKVLLKMYITRKSPVYASVKY
jgi:HD superfamily phosphohydrolase